MRAFILDSDLAELQKPETQFTMTCIRRFCGVGKFHLDGYVEVDIQIVEKVEGSVGDVSSVTKTEEIF